MNLLDKIVGNDGVHRNRFYDEKGNRIRNDQLIEMAASAALRLCQSVTDQPYLPWIPFEVISRFNSILKSSSRVLEFGSGRSTVWYARKAAHVISIEDCEPWYQRVSAILKKLDLRNVDYRYSTGEDYYSIDDVAPESVELLIIDGSYRDLCIERAHAKIVSGGYIYFDNSDMDMKIPNGERRLAEALMLNLADQWHSQPEYFTGFAPGQFFPNQGMLLQKP
jgi:hypothetical protein